MKDENEKMEQFDVLIAGGGAAGLMAAIASARCGAKTAILEHKEKTGKKILATGNGKCNYTNSMQGVSYYRGENPAFVMPVFRQFGFEKTVRFFEEIGITPKVKNGYYYPASEQASAVLEVLRLETNYLRVKEVCSCEMTRASKKNGMFVVETTRGTFTSKSLIFATGLLAAPKSGSDGSAFPHIEKFGHHFIDMVPALVPLHGKQSFFKSLAGIRADAKITLFVENTQIQTERGELQLTDYGVSGIPVFQLSRFAAKALKKKQKVHMCIDFLPDSPAEEVKRILEKRFYKENQKKTMAECLVGLFHKKLAEVLLKEAGIRLGDSPKNLSVQQLEAFLSCVKALRVDITGTKTYEQAQVCAGGIDTKEINPETMESRLVAGLYFAGELTDIDGMCGGYNLQWAWSSGYVAGSHAAECLRTE